MIDKPWKLDELEPGREARPPRASAGCDHWQKAEQLKGAGPLQKPGRLRGAAPFFPFERTAYVVLVAVYAIYAGARAVQVFQEPRAARTTFSASA